MHGTGIADTEFALSMFSENREEASQLFKRYMDEEEEASCLDPEERRLTDKEAQALIKKLCRTKSISEFLNMPREKRDKSIATLKKTGLSIRQISRLIGASFGIIRRI